MSDSGKSDCLVNKVSAATCAAEQTTLPPLVRDFSKVGSWADSLEEALAAAAARAEEALAATSIVNPPSQ